MTAARVPLARLSDEQSTRWEQDGYLLVEDALSAEEVATLVAVVDRIQLKHGPISGDPSAAVFNAFNVVELDDALLAVMDHPNLLGLIADLLGANIALLMSQIMVRPPTRRTALGWHHDGPKPHPFPRAGGLTPLLNLKVGVFLTDVHTPDRGNLLVIPGSHRRTRLELSGVLAHSAAETTEVEMDPVRATPVLARPGDVILFHNALWHAVGPSSLDRPRKVLYYTYGPLWLRLNDRRDPSPELVARSSAVRQQLLGGLARAEDHGGMHPGPDGIPLLGLIEDRSYTEVMEAEFRRELTEGRPPAGSEKA